MRLPATLGLTWLEAADASTWQWQRPATEAVIVDAPRGGLGFVEPVGAAMVSAWAAHQAAAGVALAPADNLRTPLGYATGILSRLAGRVAPLVGQTQVLPVHVAHSEDDFRAIRDRIEGLAGHDSQTHLALAQCVEDLARNVFHHARTPHGAHWAASIDRKSRLVRIGVADCGRGIADDIRSSFRDSTALDDATAVAMALEPRVSGSTQPGTNMGVGLHVVRHLALAGHGKFWLLTRRIRAVSSTDEPEAFAPRVQSVAGDWNGTAVAVLLQQDALPEVADVLKRLHDEIEGRAPHHGSLKFFRRLGPEDAGRTVLGIAPDTGPMACDRERALRLGRDEVAGPLATGKVALTWEDSKVATQAFAYALLYHPVQRHGPGALERLQFIGCSPQVTTVLRMAAAVLLADHAMAEAPP